MDNMRIWDALKAPPEEAKKTITGGRLAGMTDIKPQWRYQAMTEQFGPCGIGWKYTIEKLWSESGPDEQVFAHALVSVQIKNGDDWSDPVPGIGGNMLVEKESRGLHASDEGYKMAVTDALSVAMKMLGVGADVYMGYSETKYNNVKAPPKKFDRDQPIGFGKHKDDKWSEAPDDYLKWMAENGREISSSFAKQELAIRAKSGDVPDYSSADNPLPF